MSLLYINKIKITYFCFWIISHIVSSLPVRKPLGGVVLDVNTCGLKDAEDVGRVLCPRADIFWHQHVAVNGFPQSNGP